MGPWRQAWKGKARPETGRRISAADLPSAVEIEFQRTVEVLASLHGWSHWHDEDSRKNRRGFLDLILWRGPRLIAAECKVGRRTTTDDQLEHLERWLRAGAEAVVWRPKGWPKKERWSLIETYEATDLVELVGQGEPRHYAAGAIERRLFRKNARQDAVIAAHQLDPLVIRMAAELLRETETRS